MDLLQASKVIQELYDQGLYGGKNHPDEVWEQALKQFDIALESENDPAVLEQCVLEDNNWALHVDGRLALIRKAKLCGANSRKFLMDYYGYLAGHLFPSPEKIHAKQELQKLINSQ